MKYYKETSPDAIIACALILDMPFHILADDACSLVTPRTVLVYELVCYNSHTLK